MATLLVMGLQWGDEGKGKIIDSLAHVSDVVMRFQGGANSGHTIYHKNEKIILHHLPSGVFHPGVQSVMGWGMVITPEVLIQEMDEVERLRGKPLSGDELKISAHTSVLLPIHRRLDAKQEKTQHIGTTKRGIGPAYEDRIGRRAVRVEDVVTLSLDALKEKITNLYVTWFSDAAPYQEEIQESLNICAQFKERLGKYVGPVTQLVKTSYQNKRKILFEGAQGAMLDISQGTYPYVTSSMTGLAGVYASMSWHVPIQKRVGVAKAYCTRVGEGPFPSEMQGEEAKRLRDEGQEYGATTGRPRRVGHMDLVQLKYAIEANGIQEIILTKADVLSGYSDVGLVTSYRKGDQRFDVLEGGFEMDEDIHPEITWVPGWNAVIDDQGRWTPEIKAYCDRVEAYTGAKVNAISYGPQRDHIAFRDGKGFQDFYR